MPHAADKDLKRNVGFAGVRCAMFADQPDVAEDFLRFLNREFPRDPDVLYLSVHTYSDLSTRAAAELATTAPKSPEALELDAEALEGFMLLSRTEGIIPALEPAHVIADLGHIREQYGAALDVLVCLSGRGDKDLETVMGALG